MRPVVAVTFGDASGIGPELVARLLARPDAVNAAQIVVVGDAWVLQDGQRVAGITTPLKVIHDWKAARDGDGTPLFLEVETVAKDDVVVAQVTEAAGRGARLALTACLEAFQRGEIDAICFAPLNKQAMKKGGMHFEDELHFFADWFGVKSYFCEFNTLGTLWTSRISSHIPLAEIPKYVTKDRIKAAAPRAVVLSGGTGSEGEMPARGAFSAWASVATWCSAAAIARRLATTSGWVGL